MDGLLLVDKPIGITSFDVIRRLRRATGERKIGHAGTLDPLASGLMLVLFGKGCKQAQVLTGLRKRYRAQISLGQDSDTYDAEGELRRVSKREPSQDEILEALRRLSGEIVQVPPMYSAIKISGKEAYKRVRAGEVVSMPARHVTVFSNVLVNYEYPFVELDLEVSSGTYVRTIAHDLGRALGTGAYLSRLIRTEVGEYMLDDALGLASMSRESVQSALVPLN